MWLRSVDASHFLDPWFGVSEFTLSGEWSGLLPSGYSTQWTHHILWTPRLVFLTLHYLGSGQHHLPSGYSTQWTRHILWTPRLVCLTLPYLGSGRHPLPSGYSARWTHHILWTPHLVCLTLHYLGSGQHHLPSGYSAQWTHHILWTPGLVCLTLPYLGSGQALCPVAILPSGRITFSGPLVWCLLTLHYLGSGQHHLPSGYSAQWTRHILCTPRLVSSDFTLSGEWPGPLPSGYSLWSGHSEWTHADSLFVTPWFNVWSERRPLHKHVHHPNAGQCIIETALGQWIGLRNP